MSCVALYCSCFQERVPFQYLISTAHWRDLVLAVGPGILVPRPETELMIDLAAAALTANPNPALALLPWADLGTGSGALAIGTAQLLAQAQQQQQRQQQQQQQQGVPASSAEQQAAWDAATHPQVYAVDMSSTAVAYATANAAAHGLQETVRAVQGSWYEPLQHLQGRLGGIVSNPPYIPRSQIEAGLQAEVGQHEPMSALDGGAGAGMDSLRVRVLSRLAGVASWAPLRLVARAVRVCQFLAPTACCAALVLHSCILSGSKYTVTSYCGQY
jgi:release factor glutamine methyltransferase